MTNLIKTTLGNFVKIGNKLIRIPQESEAPIETPVMVAGLYDENDNLVKTWDELIQEGLVTVE